MYGRQNNCFVAAIVIDAQSNANPKVVFGETTAPGRATIRLMTFRQFIVIRNFV
jgi:hypothetical protein